MQRLIVKLEDGSEATILISGMTITSMHFDGMDEIEGIKEMRRASDVEFDAEHQVWHAIIRPEFVHKEPHRFMAKSRGRCIEWERKYLNSKGGVCSEMKK